MKSELTSLFVNLFLIMMRAYGQRKCDCKCKFFDVLTVLNEGGWFERSFREIYRL